MINRKAMLDSRETPKYFSDDEYFGAASKSYDFDKFDLVGDDYPDTWQTEEQFDSAE